jgi:hypothetical protein
MTITFLDLNNFFDRFLKYLGFLFRWANKLLSTVCFHSIQLAGLFEGHWAECGIVCVFFCQNKIIYNPINRKNNRPTNRLSK